MTVIRGLLGAAVGLALALLWVTASSFLCEVPVLGFLACMGLGAPPMWEAALIVIGGTIFGFVRGRG
jgi:hypothetical protein